MKYTTNLVLKDILSIIEDNFDITITDYNTPFTEYGIISIDIPLFVKILAKKFAVEVGISDIFKCFNINKLTDYICSLLNIKESDNKYEKDGCEQVKERIAIVGVSCRLPGGANSVDEYWDLLLSGKDGICDIPGNRWDFEKYYDEDESVPGKMYCKKGGFLETDIEEFDAKFFNISPKEAQALDPQQRILLELTWEAFENANLDIAKYNGSDTGVYIGISTNEYHMAHLHSGDLSKIGPYALTGSCFSAACGRVSYTFGFEGPCVSVDTACSSTLTALHLACTALQAGEADLQLVAGINLIESPSNSVGFSKLQAISVDGHSRAFDASANGYGRGEGGGVILLKRLSDAIRDNNEILGVIRSSGINQDGKSNGLTAPNGEAQEKLIRKTLFNAGLNNLDVDYVEMHGTGTKLGDPIEINAIAAIYGKGRNKDNLLKIGSVKSNIGHLEASAGISSIIKVLLSMKHNLIPANLHFQTPNPFINWEDANVEVVSKHTLWEKENGLKVAAINGFGFGGSNAHVIIEEYQEQQDVYDETAKQDGIDYVLKLSAKCETSLKELVHIYHLVLANGNEHDFLNVINTANRVRTNLDFRLSVCGGNRQMILDRMKSYLDGNDTEGVFVNTKNPLMLQKDRKVAFMFTGQGSQYLKMGQLFYDTNQVFREAFDQCDKLFKPYLMRSIVELVYGDNTDEATIQKTVYAQPLIFAVEYALYKLWEDYGIKPDLVMGHSIGEYSAAVAAGILNLEDAAKLILARSRLMDMAPGNGSMATIFAAQEKVTELLQGYKDTVCIAAINAREVCVISGSALDVEIVALRARAEGITVKELKVSHGFHSMLMEPILNEFLLVADEIDYHAPKVRFVSSLYVKEIESGHILDSEYWTRHIREMVDFYGAVTSIEEKENHVLMEVGSNRQLAALCKLIFEQDRVVAASLNIKKADRMQVAEDIALLYAAGVNLNWDKIIFAGNVNWSKTKLPNYPYDKNRYPLKLNYDRESAALSSIDCHKILGQKIDLSYLNNMVIFQSKFTATDPFFMKEHIIFNTAVSPAAAHLAMVISGIKEIDSAKSCTLSKIEFRSPLAVSGDAERKVQLCIEKGGENPKFSIHSKEFNSENDKWMLHAKGNVSMHSEYQFIELLADIKAYQQLSYKDDMETHGVYYFMEQSGFEIGKGFRGIKQISFAEEDCICKVEPLKTVPYFNEYVLYPGTIDSVLQTGFAFVQEKMRSENIFIGKDATIIPYYMEKFTYNYRPSDRLWCHTRSYFENGMIYINVVVYNDQGEVVINIDNLMAKITDSDSLLRETKNLDKMYYHTEWTPLGKVGKPDSMPLNKKYIIISEQNQAAEAVTRKVSELGISPISVNMGEDWSKLLKNICQNGDKKNLYIIFYTDGQSTDRTRLQDVDCRPMQALLSLVKVISEEGYSRGSKITIVTKDVQAFRNSGWINLSGSLVWGLSKVVSIEYPELYGGIIDCDESVFDQDSEFIYDLFNRNPQEICIRASVSYGIRLISHADYLKHTAQTDNKITLRADSCYLITGGTGTVGLSYANQFARAGAEHLLLLCRKEPDPKAMEIINRLRQSGVRINIVFGDICNYESLKNILNDIKATLPPIRGVVHAAGIINDKMIADADWLDFESVINPKVHGSMNLYRLLNEEQLDFFMMTSSVTSIVGNMGQGNYAAANYFMNIFASYLSLNHIPGYTFCWGAWSDNGMAAGNDSIANSIKRMGMKPFIREQAEKIIEDFMEHPYENLVIVDADWNHMNKSFKEATGKNSLLSKLISLEAANDNEAKENQTNGILDTLKELGTEDQEAFIIDKIRQICAKIMGFENADLLSLDDALKEQGADSLMTFSMRAAINKLFGIDINISVFFNYPTITKLVEYLLTEVLLFEDYMPEPDESEENQDNIEDILMEIAELIK